MDLALRREVLVGMTVAVGLVGSGIGPGVLCEINIDLEFRVLLGLSRRVLRGVVAGRVPWIGRLHRAPPLVCVERSRSQ
jgi:hypothetical protein